MNKQFKKLATIGLCASMLMLATGGAAQAATEPSVTYNTHVQNVGWQNYVNMNQFSGTEGQSLRLEGIHVKLDTGSYDLGIEYQTHIQNIGWEAEISDTWDGNPVPGWKTSNVTAGTYGRAWRLEGIKIRLTGADADKFDILYKTHIQNVGWEKEWKKNGEMSGTHGQSLRLEGIYIQLVKKAVTPTEPVDPIEPPKPPEMDKDPRDLNGDGTVTQDEIDQWKKIIDGDQSWDKNGNGILDPDEVDDWKAIPPQKTPPDTRANTGDIMYAPTYTPWPVHTACNADNHKWFMYMDVYPLNGVPVFEIHHTYWDGNADGSVGTLHDTQQEYKEDVAKGCKYNYIEWLHGHGNSRYPDGIHNAFDRITSVEEFLLKSTLALWTNTELLGREATQDERSWANQHTYVAFYYCMNCGTTTLTEPDVYKQ
jgi:hypothetical protein